MDEKKLASDYFMEGLNCAESVIKAYNEEFGTDIPIRIASGLGGGCAVGLALSTFIPSDPQNQLPDSFTYKNYSKWWNRAPNVGGPGSFTWGPITNTIDTSGISGSFYVVLVLNAYDATSPYGFTVRTVTCTS